MTFSESTAIMGAKSDTSSKVCQGPSRKTIVKLTCAGKKSKQNGEYKHSSTILNCRQTEYQGGADNNGRNDDVEDANMVGKQIWQHTTEDVGTVHDRQLKPDQKKLRSRMKEQTV